MKGKKHPALQQLLDREMEVKKQKDLSQRAELVKMREQQKQMKEAQNAKLLKVRRQRAMQRLETARKVAIYGRGKRKQLPLSMAITETQEAFERSSTTKKGPKAKVIKRLAETQVELERRRLRAPQFVSNTISWFNTTLPSKVITDTYAEIRNKAISKVKTAPAQFGMYINKQISKLPSRTTIVPAFTIPGGAIPYFGAKPIKVPKVKIPTRKVAKAVSGFTKRQVVVGKYVYEQAGRPIVQTGTEMVKKVVTNLPSPTYVAKRVMKYKPSKEAQVTSIAVNKGVKNITTALFMTPLSSPRGKGRPRGASGRYRVEGKPVYEEEYQQWRAKQNALNRISPSTAQTALLTPDQMQRLQMQQMQMQQTQTEAQYPSENYPQQPQPSQQQPMQQQYEQPSDYNLEDRRARQMQEQENDSILKAPNFSKGELKATGGSILTPTGPQILDAPQFNKGEMRTLRKNSNNPYDEGEVKIGERPQTNPYGEEYLDIELGSGRPVLKRRPRERWITGESL